MALAALSIPGGVGFDAEGSAMVPVSAGESKLGEIKIKSPLESLQETFGEMKESLGAMVGLQTKEEKRQEFINKKLLEQHEFERKKMNEKMVDEGMAGPQMPSNDDLEGVDTDDSTYGNFVEKAENAGSGILEGIKEAFGQVSFGEKMMAILLAGGFALFSKYSDQIEKVLQPIVQFVMDTIDFLGPEGAFAAFLGGFILLKSGLLKKGIMKAGSTILKGIKASAAAIDKQGGLVKAVGNGFEKINRGASSIVGGLKKTGGFITTNLTKGFNKLGTGIEAMNKGVAKAGGAIKGGFSKLLGLIGKGFMMMKVGMTSMLSSLGPILAPLLPVIAIAAGIAAIMFSLKSGFDTFKTSLEEGDSMFVAVLKGLGDAILTLVTLPATLVKKLVGFIAGLFGFDNFKEKLESFSIKDSIIGAFKGLTGGMFKLIKAIAKGVIAALAAALPGGKTPQEEFSRAYQEVMKGGEGKEKIETQEMPATPDDGYLPIGEKEGGYLADKQFMDQDNNKLESLVLDDDGPKSAFEVLRAKVLKFKAARDEKFKKMFGMGETDEMGVPKKLEKGESMTTTTMKTETIKKEGKVVSQSGSTVVVKGGNVQGDTINQQSTTQITGDLDVNNTERTQRSIQEHF